MELLWSRMLTALVLILACGSAVVGQESPANPGTFQKDGLCRRWAHQSVVQNNTLYLFGGKQFLNTTSGVRRETNTDFLRLDLTQTFNLAENEVPWEAIKPISSVNPPFVSQGGFFANPHDDSLILYEGQVPETEEEQFSSVWRYNINENLWSETDTRQRMDGKFPNRQSRGTYVQGRGNTTGYYLGGARAYKNSTFEGWFYDDNFQFEKTDLDTGTFITENANTLPVMQKRIGPSAVWLPVGKKGIIVVLGGTEEHKVRLSAPITPSGGIDPDSVRINPLSPMTVIWIYDIDGNEWHFQTAAGTPPWERKNYCLGATSSHDKKEHFIYVFGGGSDYNVSFFNMNDTAQNDMYILSLPSFTYQLVPLADNAPPQRQLHTCHVVNDRQMLIVGGHHENSTHPEETCSWDELYLFDMSTLQWQSSFTPATESFSVPSPVAMAIGSQTEPATGWNDDGLKHLFEGTKPGCPTDDMIQEEMDQKEARVKNATIGGTIAGALAIVFLSLFIFVNKRRRQERADMEVEFEQLKAALGFYGKGSMGSSVSSVDVSPVERGEAVQLGMPAPRRQPTEPYVVETSRPLTFLERLRYIFQFGLETKNRGLDEKDGGYSGGGGIATAYVPQVSRSASATSLDSSATAPPRQYAARGAGFRSDSAPQIRPPVPPKTPRAELV